MAKMKIILKLKKLEELQLIHDIESDSNKKAIDDILDKVIQAVKLDLLDEMDKAIEEWSFNVGR